MVVSCPYCSTRYELDSARLTGATPMLKCSKCRHIFPAPSAKKPPASSRAEKSAARQANLTLPFEEQTWKDEAETTLPHGMDRDEPDDAFTLGTEGAPDDLVLTESPAPAEIKPPAPRVVTPPPAGANAARADEPDEVEDEVDEADEITRVDDADGDITETVAARRPRRRQKPPAPPPGRNNLVALFIFFGLVVFGYGVLTRALFASPALCDRLIGRLPLVGTLGDDRLLTRKVALSDVSGGYQHIKDGKDVFVITGKAVNTAPVALHGVQILGKLFNNAGGTLESKTIFCGNVISAKVLKDLTPAEVSILQKLSPPKKFVIEPGEASTFVVVFMDPPKQTAEFTAQVVGAQRQA